MKSLFIINENMKESQLDQSYLLILAMLNFDHQVDLVFSNNAFDLVNHCNDSIQKWRALKLYGVEKFYCLNCSKQKLNDELTALIPSDFYQMKAQADWVS